MKLKNKLLPLVGVAAACATVAPIALTSCNSNGGMIDLSNMYKSKITDIPDLDSWTKSTAEDNYFTQSAAKPEIFADDFYWGNSLVNNIITFTTKKGVQVSDLDTWSVDSIEVTPVQGNAKASYTARTKTTDVAYLGSTTATIAKDLESISNVSFKEYDYEDYVFWTVSFDRNFEWTMDTSFVGAQRLLNVDTTTTLDAAGSAISVDVVSVDKLAIMNGNEDETAIVKGKVSYVNVPICLEYISEYSLWSSGVDSNVVNPTAEEESQFNKFDILWNLLEEDCSITTKVNINRHISYDYDIYNGVRDYDYTYDFAIDDSESLAVAKAITNINPYGLFTRVFESINEFTLSHYLYNISPKY